MEDKGETGRISTTQKEHGVEVVWSIGNFSSPSPEDGARYWSPLFSIGGNDWRLRIFPNGASWRNSSGRIHLDFCKISSSSGATDLLHLSVALQHVNGERECEQTYSRCFEEGWDWHEFPPLISREELLRRRRELLPSDVLTVVLTLSWDPPGTSARVTPTPECRHCKKSFAADILLSHQRKCEHRPVSCPDCGKTVPLKKFLNDDHECRKENARGNSSRVKCCLCEKDYDNESIASHQVRCMQRTIQCPGCLGEVLLREWLDGHKCQRNEGNSSRVECCLCKENYDNESIASHLERCMQRTIQCPGCSDEVLLREWFDGHKCHRTEGAVKKIPYHEIRRATRDFSHELGSGGFGTVYKGEMDNGGATVQVAVKKLKAIDKQFEAELKTLSSIKHDFLLSVLGYCEDPAHPCLVLEYMVNGSLEDRLACKDNSPPLASDVRLLIAYCSALGINHLHTKGQVHRDIKSANILLDKDMFPKVADFGLVRIGESGNSTVIQVTGNVCGTPAYMAPDAFYGDVSVKLDTFSFGVVLLELLTALPAKYEGKSLFLHMDRILNMLDSKANWNPIVANNLRNVSKRCLIREKRDRPTLSEILNDLQEILPANILRLVFNKLLPAP